jgi:hypothetical protein
LGRFFENYRNRPHFLTSFSRVKINFDMIRVGLHFGRFFSQTHPVTLARNQDNVATVVIGNFADQSPDLKTELGGRDARCFFSNATSQFGEKFLRALN